jgi:sugar lactone lactonase YvrE
MRRALPPLLLSLCATAAACGDDAPTLADAPPPDAVVLDAFEPPDAPPPDAPPPDAPPPDAPPIACDQLTTTPTITMLPGFIGTEDITFDDAGHVLESDTTSIFKTTRDGQRTVFVPNLPFRAGMRMTKSGKLVVNDDYTGTIWRIDPDGSRHSLMTGLSYPNGMEIGGDDKAYFTDQNTNTVYRIDPETGEHRVLTTGVPNPNGLTFDPTFSKLYIGSFCGSPNAIWQLDIGPDGEPGTLQPFVTDVGTGCNDGMGVDACGNVYFADYGQSVLFRVSADGQTVTQIIHDQGGYHANFDWGRGIGGWDADKLYVLAIGEGIKEVDLGVPSKER